MAGPGVLLIVRVEGFRFPCSVILLSLASTGCSAQTKEDVPGYEIMSRWEGITHEASALVHESRSLAESTTALRNVDEVLNRASRDLERASKDIVDHATWRAVELVVLVFLLVVAVKVGSFLYRMRSSRATRN